MELFTAILPTKWQPKAKAILAALVPILVAVFNAIDTGLGLKEAIIAVGGVALGLGVYHTPNRKVPA